MNPTSPVQSFSEHKASEQALRMRDARFAALQEVALGLTSTLQLSDVLERVAQMAQSLTDSIHAHIYLHDSQSDELKPSASHWAEGHTPITLKPRRTGITYTVFQSGIPMFIEDARNHPAYDKVSLDQRPGALACLPLTKGEHILGTLNIGYWQAHPFDNETRRFLDLVARYATIAIDNAQLYESATRAASELRRLYDTSLDITRQLDTSKLLDLIIHRAADLLHGTSGNFSIYDSQTNELVPCAPFGLHAMEPVERLKPGEGATGRVFQSGEPLVIQEYDSWEGRVTRIPLGRYARVLHVPVKQGNHIIGVMSVNRPKTAPAFTEEEKRLLMLFANQAAVALENARLYEIAVEKARMQHELQLGHELQVSLIPRTTPEIPGWEFSAYWEPAREVSGDFYDFFTLPDGRLVLFCADVAGKGVPAALVMATTRAVLRGAARRELTPSSALERSNNLLCPEMPPSMFITCLYAILDPITGKLQFANAGHNLPYRRGNHGAEELRATGMPLGLMPEMQYEQKETLLEPGDRVLFYSDGLVEAHNTHGEMFGFPRLRSLASADTASGATLIRCLLEQLKSFTGANWEQEDDITLLTLERTGAVEQSKWRVVDEFTLASAHGNERDAMNRVADTARNLGMESARIERLKTAVAETVMNAIEHGNQNQPELPVLIRVRASADAIAVRVTDHGNRGPIGEPQTPDLAAKLAGLQSPRGWGLFLVKQMVDEMNTSDEEGQHAVELVLGIKEKGA